MDGTAGDEICFLFHRQEGQNNVETIFTSPHRRERRRGDEATNNTKLNMRKLRQTVIGLLPLGQRSQLTSGTTGTCRLRTHYW